MSTVKASASIKRPIMRYAFQSILLPAIFFVVSSCGPTDGTSNDRADERDTGDPISNQTLLQVEAEILRTILDHDGKTYIEYFFSILLNGVPANNAVITVNGINVPRIVGFIDGYYDLREPETSYFPGIDYAVVVRQGGQTYTDTMKAPGGISVNQEGTSIKWEHNGMYAAIDVEHLFGQTTYYVPKVRPGPLVMPQTIPSSAYPSAGTYRIAISVANIRDSFDSLHGIKTHFKVEDFRELRVLKSN